MKKIMTCPVAAFIATFTLSAIVLAEEEPKEAPSPNQIVEEAPVEEWVAIPTEDLLVMRLAPDAEGNPREVIIQLMPAPFSQGWVHNIKLLAREGWYDGISVNRVQDNYVVQWGDPNYDNPESDGEKKTLPDGLRVMREEDYSATGLLSIADPRGRPRLNYILGAMMMRNAMIAANGEVPIPEGFAEALENGETPPSYESNIGDNYGELATHMLGWPITGAMGDNRNDGYKFWPVHCYGMVGVGRNLSPDTGSGAELYTVIGHAPRHLDRNIALVGRVIEGIEYLSSLPRGKGELGFYAEDEFDKRTPILSIDVAADLLESETAPAGLTYDYEYLSTESETFAKYAEARANRRDPFFIVPAGGADICNIPVPVRPAPNG